MMLGLGSGTPQHQKIQNSMNVSDALDVTCIFFARTCSSDNPQWEMHSALHAKRRSFSMGIVLGATEKIPQQ